MGESIGEDDLALLQEKTVIIAFDCDIKSHTGQKQAMQQAYNLRAQGIETVILNPYLLGDDNGIDDYINQHGITAFNQLLQFDLLSVEEYRLYITTQHKEIDISKVRRTEKYDADSKIEYILLIRLAYFS